MDKAPTVVELTEALRNSALWYPCARSPHLVHDGRGQPWMHLVRQARAQRHHLGLPLRGSHRQWGDALL